MKPKVYLTAPLMDAAMDRLGSLFQLTVRNVDQDGPLDAQSLCEAVHGQDALISFLTDRIDANLFAAGTDLKIVANYAVGYNNIDLAAAQRANVWVSNTPGVLTESTADMAWALLMAAARNIVPGDRLVRSGEWTGWDATELLGVELSGSTLGVIGLGRIGKAVARRAAGFNMRVIAWNRSEISQSEQSSLGIEMVSVDELCRRSDFLSLHCALAPETTHLIDRERLSAMKPQSIIINTARGPCIDEVALAEAIRRGSIGGAGLDVFEREPSVEADLLELDQVVLAPHLGSATQTTRMAMAELVIRNISAACSGEQPPTPIQPRS